MLYRSTRGAETLYTSSEAVLMGLAPDGGLFMPDQIDWKAFPAEDAMQDDARSLSARILHFFFDDIHGMDEIVTRAYADKFDTEELTPLAALSDRYLIELFHGPTSAFKDVALSVLPQLLVQAKKETNDPNETVILTATSGDTGKAALAGFQDVPGVKIIVFYPDGGVSPVQRLQMATQEGGNVFVAAINGNFDDAQTGVKQIFSQVVQEELLKDRKAVLSSANSINIGRLVPQIMYYFKAYADLLSAGKITFGDPIDFTVPTGNFGDILAGYFAKKLGLPVRKLVCASNENNVLTDFLKTGVYDRNRPFYRTASPSMDILVSSNLERLLYLLTDENAGEVAAYMKSLNKTGRYQVSGRVFERLQETFACGFADDADTKEAIGKLWKEEQYLMDTHTGVAYAVSSKFVTKGIPMVVLSTASPYKFPQAVADALGIAGNETDEFVLIDRIHETTGVPVPRNLAVLQQKEVRFNTVIEKDEMLSYVLGKI